ncbi:hypothetical protein NWF34_09665, partial [Gordonia sp. GONU]|uniref:hypothetical protein n=1 Tax=Gordonia sp. GONU TaxID=2972949 RepID=UPI0021AC138F
LPVSSTIRTAPSRNSRSYFFRFSGIVLLIIDASTVRGEPQCDAQDRQSSPSLQVILSRDQQGSVSGYSSQTDTISFKWRNDA